MLDLTVVLDAKLGMVDWGAVSPPSREAPWWTCVAHLAGARNGGYELVGALATSRGAAMIRGAGEVVERFCLAVDGPWDADFPLDAPGWSTGPRPLDLTGWIRSDWDGPSIAARNLVDGTRVNVPEPLLADRVEDRHRATNFGPSGCAAGTSLEMAATHALLELVERDAAISAWSACAPARRIDADEALGAGLIGSALRADVARVSDRLGLDFVWGLLPALRGGIAVAFGALLDDAGQCHGVGMKAALVPDRALLGSFVESLQQYVVLRTEAPESNPRPASDQERAAHFASAEGRAQLSAWVGAWEPAGPIPGWDGVHDLQSLIAAIERDGGVPLAIDLSGRLPDTVSQMGWRVVQCAIPGFLTLTISDLEPAEQPRSRAAEVVWNAPHFMI